MIFLSFDSKSEFWILLILNLGTLLILNILCSGVINLIIVDDSIEIKFVTKPVIGSLKERKFKFSEIKKWDHISYSRHPDSLVIHLKTNEKITLTFRLFAFSNNYHDLLSDFKEWIESQSKRSVNKESVAYNITEHFYSSKKAKAIAVILYSLLILDFFLMIFNAWELRTLFAFLLIPLILVGMLFIVKLLLFRKKSV